MACCLILMCSRSTTHGTAGNAVETPVTPINGPVSFASKVETNPQVTCKSPEPALPDQICTPGVARTQDVSIICGQPTSKFRPTPAQANQFSKQVMKMYGIKSAPASQYQLDAKEPLEVGGDHFAIANMWLMPIKLAHQKDQIENLGHRLICQQHRSPAEIQALFAKDWRLVK